jgi:hypothetical protein
VPAGKGRLCVLQGVQCLLPRPPPIWNGTGDFAAALGMVRCPSYLLSRNRCDQVVAFGPGLS